MNPRAAFTTYTLSRGASSANLSTSPNIYDIGLNGGEAEIRTLGAFASLVFKTSSLNHSDTSPCVESQNSEIEHIEISYLYIIPRKSALVNNFFQKLHEKA